MDIELKQAQAKYEREQKQRADQARQRVERERKAKDEARARQQEMEEAQRIRRLEEASAAERARLQREQDVMAGGGVEFNRVLLGSLSRGSAGDKITLPASAIAELSEQSALEKGPMLFELSLAGGDADVASSPRQQLQEAVEEGGGPSETKGRRTHAGVMEFTAEEGWVGLPSHVWENLGLGSATDGRAASGTEVARVRVRYVRLGKCTYTKLQPMGLDFADVPNHKAVLETALRGHATLTEGDVLRVNHGGHAYALRVLELKPEPQVTIIEADVETDVVPPEAADVAASGGGRTLAPLKLGEHARSSVEQGQYRYFKFNVDEALAETVAAGEVELVISLDVEKGSTLSSSSSSSSSSSGGDADLYVAAHPVLYPTQHQHGWSNHDAGSKVMAICGSAEGGGGGGGGTAQQFLGAGSYSVGVYGYQGRTEFSLSVVAWPRKAGQIIGAGSVGEEVEEGGVGFVQCENCRQRVPDGSLMLHEAYCRRHNVACDHPGCGAVLRRQERDEHVHCVTCGQGMRSNELEKHRRVNHEALSCECGVVLPMAEMVKHKSESCPLRNVVCRFCGDIVQAGGEATSARDRLAGLTGHEAECGSRTTPCEICGRAIMLKDADVHLAAVHAAPTARASTPPRGISEPASSSGPRAVAQNFAAAVPSPAADEPVIPSLACPVCGLAFSGAGRERSLDRHLDEHFSGTGGDPTPVAERMDVDSGGGQREGEAMEEGTLDTRGAVEAVNQQPSPSDTSYRRSTAVECPICGTAVHSERDLSAHFDLVH